MASLDHIELTYIENIHPWHHQGPASIPDKTSYCQASKPRDLYLELKFDKHLGSNAAEVPVKFQSDAMI